VNLGGKLDVNLGGKTHNLVTLRQKWLDRDKRAQDGVQVSAHPGCAQGQGQGDTGTFVPISHENCFFSQASSRIATKLAHDDLQGTRMHCRNCYFQTKIDLRRRSIYVRMHDAILTVVGGLLPNYCYSVYQPVVNQSSLS